MKKEISKTKFFCIFTKEAAVGIGTIFMCFLGVSSVMVSMDQDKGEESKISPGFRKFFQNSTLICWGFFIALIAYCAIVAFKTNEQAKKEIQDRKIRTNDLESFGAVKSELKGIKSTLDSIKTWSDNDKTSSSNRNTALSKLATNDKLDQVVQGFDKIATKFDSLNANNAKIAQQNAQFVQNSQQDFLFQQQWLQNFGTQFFNHLEKMNDFYRKVKNDHEKKEKSDLKIV